MTFRVVVTQAAQDDAAEYVKFIREEQQAPAAAKQWLENLRKEIRSLSTEGHIYKRLDGIDGNPTDYRSKGFYSHRIIYSIEQAANRIQVVRIYHNSRQPLGPKDL